MMVLPFQAIRANKETVERLNVPPYDVVEVSDVLKHAENNPASFFRITRSEAFMGEVNPYSAEVYQKARENLERFLAEGYLFRENKPKFYWLSQTWQNRTQNGLYAAVSCREYLDNAIKKHEFTRKDKEEDRTNHIMTVGVGSGPVFLAFNKTPDYDAIVNEALKTGKEYAFTDENGVYNELRIIEDDSLIARITDYFKNRDSFYIADGHHRAASAVNVYQKGKKTRGMGSGFFMAVIFPQDELRIFPYNRIVLDLNGLTDEEFLKRLGDTFEIRDSDSLSTERKGNIKMLLGERTYEITPKAGSFNDKSPIESLDVSILQKNVLTRILGIDDPRTSNRIRFVGGLKGVSEISDWVKSGKAKVGFSLCPVTMQDLIEIVNGNEMMPPKSTWFEPKLRDGLVSYEL